MPLPTVSHSEQYSKWTGFVYIFNLIVGTGALALPHSFSQAGWLLSLIAITILAFMSYVTATFVVESMATTNAIRHWQRVKHSKNSEFALSNPAASRMSNSESGDGSSYEESVEDDSTHDPSEEYAPLLENSIPHRHPMPMDYYSITEKIELGEMMKVYFKKVGVTLFYICICIYLYGDLAIYATAVAKSLRDVTCTIPMATIGNWTNSTSTSNSSCWESVYITRSNTYRLYVVCFLVLLGPFVFFNVQKTKYLQIFTTVLRWVAFISMIILAISRLSSGDGNGHPKLANFDYLPQLFGVSVYSFMCHHSLPSLVTPVSDKRKLTCIFASDYVLILCFYLLLAFTGIFAFDSVQDLYTLNFQPDKSGESNIGMVLLRYFLALFPVFTLSTSFPIIGITLRNNLQALILGDNISPTGGKYVFLPLLAIIPPIIVSLVSEDVGFLINVTGTYAGAGIQYVIPTVLVYRARRLADEKFGTGIKNCHGSVFRHKAWLVFVTVWAAACLVLGSINNIMMLIRSG